MGTFVLHLIQTFLQDVRYLSNLFHPGAVRDDGDLKPELLHEADSFDEFGVDGRLATTDHDYRSEPAIGHKLKAVEQLLVIVFDRLVQDVHVDAMVAGIVASGRDIEVDRDRSEVWNAA